MQGCVGTGRVRGCCSDSDAVMVRRNVEEGIAAVALVKQRAGDATMKTISGQQKHKAGLLVGLQREGQPHPHRTFVGFRFVMKLFAQVDGCADGPERAEVGAVSMVVSD